MGECKQLKILKKYHKPFAKDIREATIRGDHDDCIPELQKLRNKLGLTRPVEDYRKILEGELGGELSPAKDPREFLVARGDGTVHVGSIPNPIRPLVSSNN